MSSDNIADIVEELREVQNKSYDLGLMLKLPVPVIDAIHLTYSLPSDRLRHVLFEFTNQTEPKPTWRVIVDALESPVINLPHLAKKVEAAHLLDSTSTRDVSETALITGMYICYSTFWSGVAGLYTTLSEGTYNIAPEEGGRIHHDK